MTRDFSPGAKELLMQYVDDVIAGKQLEMEKESLISRDRTG